MVIYVCDNPACGKQEPAAQNKRRDDIWPEGWVVRYHPVAGRQLHGCCHDCEMAARKAADKDGG